MDFLWSMPFVRRKEYSLECASRYNFGEFEHYSRITRRQGSHFSGSFLWMDLHDCMWNVKLHAQTISKKVMHGLLEEDHMHIAIRTRRFREIKLLMDKIILSFLQAAFKFSFFIIILLNIVIMSDRAWEVGQKVPETFFAILNHNILLY